jgi:hypothetical protein
MASQKNQSPQCHITLYLEFNTTAPIPRVFPKEYTDTAVKRLKMWESGEKEVCPRRGHLQIIIPLSHLLFVKCEGSKQDIPKPSLTSWFGLRFAFASLCSKTKEEKQIWKLSKPNNPWANNKHVHMYIAYRGAFPFPVLLLAAWRWKQCLERYMMKRKYCKR